MPKKQKQAVVVIHGIGEQRPTETLRNFVTERGKIIPRRIYGNCAKHQRKLTDAIKKARQIALMPYTGPTHL